MVNLPENTFSNISNKILYNPKLNFTDARLYASIAFFCEKYGSCIASTSYFTKRQEDPLKKPYDWEPDERTIRRSLNKLKTLKLIIIEQNGKQRKITLPFSARYQATDEFIPQKEESSPSVLEIIDEIEIKQKIKYPTFSLTDVNSTFGVYKRQVVFTIAKSIYQKKYIGVRLAGEKVSEKMLHNLLEVFDIGKCDGLVVYLKDYSAEIKDPDYYIMASVINAHKRQLKKLERQA